MMSKSFLLKVYKYVPVLIIMLTFSPIIFTYGIGKMSQTYDYLIYIILSVFVFGYYWKIENIFHDNINILHHCMY